MNNKKTEPSGPSQEEEVVEEHELYLGDFLVRTEFFTKEYYHKLNG